MHNDENPILNNPYEEPLWHYATNLQGELDYSRPVKGRRIFTPEVQTIPVRQGRQGELMELNEVVEAEHSSHIVNLLRREIGIWRGAKYPQTTRITRELLHFWFRNPERDTTQTLFFAQREAIETAIWLGEKEASFCLLDQRTFECDWKSINTIATHKNGGNKIELFYFFPEGWFNRAVAALRIDKDERLQRWWGSEEWQDLLEISGAVRAQYVADRFKDALKYKYSYPFPIYEKPDEGGRVMYYMIHASDHQEAPILMNRAYAKALDIKETGSQMDLFHQNLKDLVKY